MCLQDLLKLVPTVAPLRVSSDDEAMHYLCEAHFFLLVSGVFDIKDSPSQLPPVGPSSRWLQVQILPASHRLLPWLRLSRQRPVTAGHYHALVNSVAHMDTITICGCVSTVCE